VEPFLRRRRDTLSQRSSTYVTAGSTLSRDPFSLRTRTPCGHLEEHPGALPMAGVAFVWVVCRYRVFSVFSCFCVILARHACAYLCICPYLCLSAWPWAYRRVSIASGRALRPSVGRARNLMGTIVVAAVRCSLSRYADVSRSPGRRRRGRYDLHPSVCAALCSVLCRVCAALCSVLCRVCRLLCLSASAARHAEGSA
jgi:hypothetical protein